MNKVVVILICTILLGCSNKKSDSFIDPYIEKIVIPIDENYLNYYQVWQNFEFENKQKLIAYNNKRHSLDFFDLSNKKVIGQVLLESDGPNAVGSINSLYYHNQDSVFIYERGKLHIINDLGEKRHTFSLYDFFDAGVNGEPICNYYFKLYYEANTKSVPFYLLYHNIEQDEKSNKPLVGKLNIEDGSVKFLPIFHTKFFKRHSNQVGYITYLGFNGNMKEDFLYNFQYQSTIFLLEKNGELLLSDDSKTISPLIDVNEIDSHAILNTHYLTPIYDQWRELIYRFNWDSPKSNDKSVEFIDKGISLDIYNNKLKKITHLNLPQYTYQINNWFVNSKGLYMNVAHPSNPNLGEDELVFHLFDFSDN